MMSACRAALAGFGEEPLMGVVCGCVRVCVECVWVCVRARVWGVCARTCVVSVCGVCVCAHA